MVDSNEIVKGGGEYKMKKLTIGAVVGLVILFSLALPVLAGSEGDGSGYGIQPGFEVATSNTECAGHGSFGAFGKDASLGIQKVHATFLQSFPGPGTDGTQTGLNNSGLCGNRQGNL